jgi:hypothetical protein
MIRSQSCYPSHSQAIILRTVGSLSVQARSRTWSSTFAGSRANPAHSKDISRPSMFSSAGEIRTRRHWFLRPAAQPLAYRTMKATHTGFEPVISTVTGWRPLQTGPMGRVVRCSTPRGTIEIRTRSRCFADIFRAIRTGAG